MKTIIYMVEALRHQKQQLIKVIGYNNYTNSFAHFLKDQTIN